MGSGYWGSVVKSVMTTNNEIIRAENEEFGDRFWGRRNPSWAKCRVSAISSCLGSNDFGIY